MMAQLPSNLIVLNQVSWTRYGMPPGQSRVQNEPVILLEAQKQKQWMAMVSRDLVFRSIAGHGPTPGVSLSPLGLPTADSLASESCAS